MDNEEFEIEYIEGMDRVIEALVQGITLISANKAGKIYFTYKNNRVIIVETNCKYSLKIDDFREDFKDFKFVNLESLHEQEYDFSRDEEYYNWKHK